jgi:hypothetical protein
MQTIKAADTPIKALRGDEKSPSLTQQDFENTIKELKEKLQKDREEKRNHVHTALIIALHTDALWEKP